jgi:hypothetical protein
VGAVRVTGGRIAAWSTEFAAAIGAGCALLGTSSVRDVLLSGGTFSAVALSGAGIGAGFAFRGDSRVGRVVIAAATVTATGSAGAGIGAGEGSIGDSTVGEIVIEDSTVAAESLGLGAGIGAALGNSGTSVVGSIRVSRSEVRALAGANAAGIGGGYSWNGNATVANISIVDSVVVADSIGPGLQLGGDSRIASCVVAGSDVRTGAVAAAALVVRGRLALECTTNESFCISGASLDFRDAQIEATTSTRTFVDPAVLAPAGIRPADFYGQYRADSQSEAAWHHPLLHFARVSVGGLALCTLVFAGGRHSRKVAFAEAQMRGLVIALPANETYKVEVLDNGDTVGRLCHGEVANFSVGIGELMCDSVSLCPAEGLSDAAIAGLALGSIVVVAAIGIVLVIVFRKRPRRADYASYVDSVGVNDAT